MARAAIYTRISRDPREQEVGVKRQEADCRKIAEANGWKAAEVYVDNDVTAAQPMEARPSFMRMLDDAKDGTFEAIIAWRDDRLWRDPDHQRAVFRICQDVGVKQIVTTEGSYDPHSISDRLVSGFKALVSEYEVAVTKLRVRRALRDRADQGLPHGPWRPFGYEDDKVTIREEEAELVREAASRLLGGESLTAVAKDWNERGILTTRGNPWSHGTLRKLLLRPRYVGKRIHRGEVIGEAAWDAILDEVSFHHLERLLTGTPSRKQPRGSHLLTGLLRCDQCGDWLTVKYQHGQRVYTTSQRGACGSYRTINADAADRLIRDSVIDVLARRLPEALDHVGDNDTAPLYQEVHAVQARLDDLAEMFADGELSRREWSQARQSLVERQERLEDQIKSVPGLDLPDALPEGRNELEGAWEAESMEWRRRLVRGVLSRIEVAPGKSGRQPGTYKGVDLRLKPYWLL